MAQEIAFEYLLAALEATKGTLVNPPTRYMSLMGTLGRDESYYEPEESSGTLAALTRSKLIREWSTWEADGGADTRLMPFLLAMAVNGSVTTPTTPAGATTAKLWTFSRSMTSFTLKSASIYWGDPNMLQLASAMCMVDELTIGGDASGEDGVTCSVSGLGRAWAEVAPSSTPANNPGPLLVPQWTQVWMDDSGTVGTTELVERVISAELTINTGVTYKYLATGPTASKTVVKVGIQKATPELTVTLELTDDTEFALAQSGAMVMTRVRWNGDLIESVTTPAPADYYHFIQCDIYGQLRTPDWGDLEGSNRTVTYTQRGHLNTTWGTDLVMRVQNDQATL